MAKDNFSTQAAQYAQFRPQYPAEMYDFLFEKTLGFAAAWDCGAGNGQVAQHLAQRFERVLATDISAAQLAKAPPLPNVRYAVEPAEQCSAADGAFDLIVVAQAAHWFDFGRFYPEAQRVLRPGGLLALVGYGLFRAGEPVDALLDHFYEHTTGPFWDAERQHIDAHYRSLPPMPMQELAGPTDFSIEVAWRREQYLGFLSTWSAVQHFIRAEGHDPVVAFAPKIEAVWPENEVKTVRFPIFMRLGRG